ncbi:hypothetical protein Cni_G07688 [Canna indica]|uniref:Uncharacterized protein n=1 Tax=Canna indica TaxID=4628 RepID=A0AAQ3JZH0_9LILI|nr:hypothetical protein Cni_G07688 [Canna indica]
MGGRVGAEHDYYERGALDAFRDRGPYGLNAQLCRLNLTFDNAMNYHGWYYNDTLEKYSASIRRLHQILLILISRNLGLSSNYFNEMFGKAVQAVRMNYYLSYARPDLALGLSPHSTTTRSPCCSRTQALSACKFAKTARGCPSTLAIPNALVINI